MFGFCSFLSYNANALGSLHPLLLVLPFSRPLAPSFAPSRFLFYPGIGGSFGSLVTQTPVSMGYIYRVCFAFHTPIVSPTLSLPLPVSLGPRRSPRRLVLLPLRWSLVFLQSRCVHVGRCSRCCCCCPSHGQGSERMSAIGHKG